MQICNHSVMHQKIMVCVLTDLAEMATTMLVIIGETMHGYNMNRTSHSCHSNC